MVDGNRRLQWNSGEIELIPVTPVLRPVDFEATVETPGNEWLARNPAPARVPTLWRKYTGELADGFGRRCGYAAMLDPTDGTVDHYRSVKNHRHLAYRWDNYRFASAPLNSSKKNLDDAVLDPYEVGADWFEIILPSLQLRLTDKVPAEMREKAEFTISRLGLRDGERIIRWRRAWYEAYLSGRLPIEGLQEMAPLLAAAVVRLHS
jgi:hypothetical protein